MSMRKREEIQEVLRGITDGQQEDYTPQRPIRLAGIQFSCSENKSNNIQRAVEFTKVCLEKCPKIICFAEFFSLPWLFLNKEVDLTLYSESVPGPSTEPFFSLSSEFDTVFICPILEHEGEKFFNSTIIIEKGNVVGCYRKVQLSNIPFWEETKGLTPGDRGFPVFQTGAGLIGIQIGWDNFFPEGARILALNGAEIVLAPTSSAFESYNRWINALSGNAIANNLYFFRVNRVGKEGYLDFYGRSCCIDPFGELVTEPAFHKDAVFIVDIDLSVVALARQEFPFLKERRTELYDKILNAMSP
jgi:N-carbamoylputrescine amidase